MYFFADCIFLLTTVQCNGKIPLLLTPNENQFFNHTTKSVRQADFSL